MRNTLASITALLLFGAGISPATAASISVSPTTVELAAPASASQLTLRNMSTKPGTVQVRVFRWTMVDGKEKLEPTKSVVASPPSVKLPPGKEYAIRIVRVSKTPVKGEESYRVLVDELPTKTPGQATVNMVVRQSIPVFFTQADATAPDVAWSLARQGGKTILTGHNSGQTRLKISDLTLSQGGKTVVNAKGLVGYVLGGSTMSFPVSSKVSPGSTVALKATSNLGPYSATTGR